MSRIPTSIWLRAGVGLLLGGLAMVFFGSVILHQGESVPAVFFAAGALVAFIGGVTVSEIAWKYLRLHREPSSPPDQDSPRIIT